MSGDNNNNNIDDAEEAIVKSTISSWFKENLTTILVPLGSIIIAGVISYGSFVRQNTLLETRLATLESTRVELVADMKDFVQDLKALEDKVDTNKDEVRNLVINEGRDLERTIIRLEARLDSISNRVTYMDGIGTRPAFNLPPMTGNSPIEYFDVVPEEIYGPRQ